MGAALLAMEHFNARNASVVPELASLVSESCPVQFELHASRFFDSGMGPSHVASRSLFEAGEPPCAIAGPSSDVAGRDLSVLAQAADFPIVLAKSYDLSSVQSLVSPYTSCVYPDAVVTAQRLVDFLRAKGRTNYVSVFYPLSNFGLQWKDVLDLVLDSYEMESYLQVMMNHNVDSNMSEEQDLVTQNLRKVKERGFRTIVVPLDDPLWSIPLLARAADELQMNNGNYFWVWLGDVAARHMNDSSERHSPEVRRLMFGSAWMMAVETVCLTNGTSAGEDDPSSGGGNPDRFHHALTSQSADFVDRLNAVNPIPAGEPGHFAASPTFFTDMRNRSVELGAGFMYDAVMSIGIGACRSLLDSSAGGGGDAGASADTVGLALLRGIRLANFTGASGTVRFGDRRAAMGSRDSQTANFAALNLLPASDSDAVDEHHFSDFYCAENGTWEQRANFTYADGRHVPPDLLRDVPSQNYIPSGLRIFGYACFGLVVLLAIASSGWVFWRREHRVVRAAQPVFLQQLIFGSVVFASAIVPLSFDETTGLNEGQLSACCMAVPWLISAGHMITYCALFAKLWRVNKVLQFTRRKITVTQVLWPFAILFGASTLVLGLWTGLDPLVWTRDVIDPYTGESVGYCQSDDLWAYAATLAVLMFIPTALTGVMAWKTKDVDALYSDSSWIFTLIVLQAELYIIAVPVVAALRTASVTGEYAGFALILTIFPLSTLLLIIAPKIYAYRIDRRGQNQSQAKRGTRQGVRVSGLSDSQATTSQVQHGLRSEELVSSLSETVPHINHEGNRSQMAESVQEPALQPVVENTADAAEEEDEKDDQ
jgi:7 transmembrane sweet-taste receptor of 3 GCPR/Receptor family ligand binding region